MSRVAVLIDFENLVIGAEESLPGHADPVPYAAIELVSQDYGTVAVRRAYADWTKFRFNRYQEHLSINGVDLIHITRFGVQQKNAADIRLAVDAMELLMTHPDVEVFVLVAGDGDYSPLAQRLREFGRHVVGVGTEASASRRLVAVCSEYKYWATLVAQIDPRVRTAAEAEFDIDAAERLLVNAMRQARQPVSAAVLKNRMLSLDGSFDERNYGCRSFREFLGRMGHVVTTERRAYDLVVALPDSENADDLRRSVRATLVAEQVEPATPTLLAQLRATGADLPMQPETRDALLSSVHYAWRKGRLRHVSDIGDVLLDEETGHVPNKLTRLHLRHALVYPDAAVIPLREKPESDSRPLRQCSLAPYDNSPCTDWIRRAHVAWLAWAMYRIRRSDELDELMVSTFFADAHDYGRELVVEARRVLDRRLS